MKTKFTKGNWHIKQTFMDNTNIPVQSVLITDIDYGLLESPVICDLWGYWTEEGKATANLLLHSKDMFYYLVLIAKSEGWEDTFDLLEKILGWRPTYDTTEFDALVKEAKDYFKSESK